MSKLNRRRGKDFERFVARYLGGRRVGILGKEDVEFKHLACECKERKRLPALIVQAMQQAERSNPRKVPFVALHEHNRPHREDLVVLKIDDFKEYVDWLETGK